MAPGLIAWMIGAALAGTGVETGVQVGGAGLAPREAWLGTEPVAVGVVISPRLAVWTGPTVGLELDVPLEFLPAAHGRIVGPHVTLLLHALGSPNSRLLFRLGGGAEEHRWRADDPDDGVSKHWMGEAHFGLAGDIRALGALRFRVQLDATLAVGRNDVGPALSPGLALTVGIGARFDLRQDSDKDRIPNKDDQCPDQAEDEDGFEDEDGCPDPDNDQDGVPDALDGCDDEPEDMDGVEDYDGCPE